ncbi:MAG: AAA family ATPase [Epsilonproteobacteria bacterium]|nr:AAA family ATPase [Campylobacterota bacterium]MBD3839249.1 AAA family ATPase [Campylobacterota bacterium]
MKKMWQTSNKNIRVIIVSVTALLLLIFYALFRDNAHLIGKEEATKLLEQSTPLSLYVDEPYLYIKSSTFHYKVPSSAIDKEILFGHDKVVEYAQDNTMLFDMIMLLMLLFFIFMILKRTSQQTQNLSQEKLHAHGNLNKFDNSIIPLKSSTKFHQIAGIKDVKEEIEEIISFLKEPQKFKSLGIHMPKGVLLVGPPGVGKTLIASAMAGEANVPFFYQSGSSFAQIYVGMGAKRVSELFASASKVAPSIIFIDEIDAVGKKRGVGGNDEREATLNQLLTEMDGFAQNSGVIVIGATNKIDVLDDALLRSGRFDRRIFVSLPDVEERKSILELYLKNKKHAIDTKSIAYMTVGFSSATLATLINESALHALRCGKKMIDNSDIEAVKDRVFIGKKRVKNFTKKERELESLYQASKAVVASWLEVEFDKVDIISPHLRIHAHEIESLDELKNQLKVLLAGKVMSQIQYNQSFSNAKEDIYEARVLVKKMVDDFAMGSELFGTQKDVTMLLYEANSELEALLSKLSPIIHRVQEHLLREESITYIKTKEYIDEIF